MGTANKLEIIISAVDKNVSAAFKRLDASLGAAHRSTLKYQNVTRALTAPINAVTGSLARLGVALGTTFAAGKYLQVAEEYTNINARLRLVTSSSEELKQVQGDLYDLSQRTGTSYTANADTYQKLAIGLSAAGASSKELLGINEAVSKSLIVNGSSAEMASSFLLQFGQAMGSGVLQGDEFRAMMESNSYFAKNLATALNTDIAGLRKMSKAGELTAAAIRKAVPDMLKQINEDFGKMPLTIGRAMTMLGNVFSKIVNGSNEAGGATGKIAKAITDFVTVLEKNSGKIEQFVIALVNMAIKTAETVIKYKEWIAAILGSLLAVGVLVKIAEAFTAINSAVVILLGMQIGPWLMSLRTAALAAAAGTTALSIAFKGFIVLAAAEGVINIVRAVKAFFEMRNAQKQAATAADNAASAQQRFQDKLKKISTESGVTVTSLSEMRKAFADGRIEYDALTNTYSKGSGKMAADAAKTAAAQKAALLPVPKELADAYKKNVDRIKAILDDLIGRQRSLAEELRAMGRTGMSDLGAWRDRKKEAEEYYAAAQRAANAGNFAEAVKLADKAKEAYKDLNEEVKSGDQVSISKAAALKTAMSGVLAAGQLAINILKQEKTAAENANKAMNEATSGQLDPATLEASKKGTTELYEGVIKVGDTWRNVWQETDAQGAKVINSTIAHLDVMSKPRTVVLHIKEVVEKATGGLIQKFATGGKLAGYGGGDRIPALLEAGEFIIRKEAVSRFGAGLFSALNSLRIPALPGFATGGQVDSSSSSASTASFNIIFPSGNAVGPFQGSRALIRQLDRERQHMALGSS